jgi:CHAT domain-containing protein/Tfp pilus assembly protein PilF
VILVAVLVAALLVTQAPAAPPQILSANVPVHATLAGGERTTYSFEVPANHAARVTIAQQGVDVGAIVRRRGDSTPIPTLNFIASPVGDEHWYPLVLDSAATWELRVSATWPNAARGNYTVTVDIVPADDRDRAIAAARATHIEGWRAMSNPDGAGLQKAAVHLAAAADAALAAGDIALAAESTFQHGRMQDQLGDPASSLTTQLRALQLFTQLGRPDRESRVHNRIAEMYRKMGAVTDAERHYDLALPLARASEDQESIADILNNSGLLMMNTGRPEEALAQFEGALPLARAINSANVEAALLNNSSEAYRLMGMFEKSIEMSRAAQEPVARLNVPRRTARHLTMLATSLYEAGDRTATEDALQRSLEVYRQARDEAGYAVTLAFYGRILAASGETDRALAAFGESRPLLKKSGNLVGEATLLASWAELDIDHRQYAAALEKLDQAIALSQSANNPYIETRSHYLRAVALHRDQRLDEAVQAISLVVDRVEGMRGSMARSDLRTSYLAAVRSYYDMYVDLLQQRGDAAAAFEVSERARARALLEGLAESAAKIAKGADPRLLATQRAVQRELNAKETYRAEVALRDGRDSAAARAVEADIERLLAQWTSIRAQLRKDSPAYAALQQPQPIDLRGLQQSLLDANTVMIAYHLGRDHSYAWVIDRESIAVRRLPAMGAIEKVARRYHEALSRELEDLTAAQRDKASAAAAAAGRQLADLVLKPVEAGVRGKRLLIVADRALHYVPFTALPTSSGRPLLAAHEVVYLPSASVLATLRAGSKPVTLNASTAVFADPVFSKADPRFAAPAAPPSPSRAGDDGSYGRLRFSRREAEAIGERAPGAYQALDFAASKSAVMSRDLRKYSVLHFATHGSLNTEHPELSGLVFSLFDKSGKSIDGFLRLHEIYNLDLDADLVVLSACRTALGREVHGEGLIGLTRGFMYAGASRVVSSVWNVDDRASALLMSRFYDAMRVRKLAPAAALREAQLSLMHDPRWSNPHYWAAFALQGEWK